MDPTNQPAASEENPGEIQHETGAARSLADAFSKLSQAESNPPPPAAPEPGAKAPVTSPAAPADAPPAPSSEGKKFSVTDVLGNALKKPGEEAPAADNEEMPPDVATSTDKAQSSWRSLKDQLKSRTREAENLRRELEEFRTKHPALDESEITQMRQRLEEQEQALRVSKVEATKEYKEAVARPLAGIRESVSKIAEKHGIPKKDIFEVFESEDTDAQSEALSDLAAGLPEFDKIRLYELVRENAKVLNLKKKVLGNSEEALRRIEAARQQEEEKSREQTSKEYTRAVDTVWKGLEEAVPIFKRQEGNDPWNEQIDQLVESVRSTDFNTLDSAGRAKLATRGAVAPVLLQMLQDLYSEHQEVVEELNGIKDATPKAGIGSVQSQRDSEGSPDPDASFFGTISSALRG